MLTCKEFLSELTDFLDEATDREIRAKLERHIAECPNCWVVCDTTKKTIKVYKGMESCSIPQDVHTSLMAAVEKKMHINDLHATMLYLLGLDHEKLTYRYSGRDYRLTDVYGEVHKEILA